MKIRKRNDGFSLMEMIVAVAIMAVLGGILMPQITQYIETSKVVKDKQTIENVYMAVSAALVSVTAVGDEESLGLSGNQKEGAVMSLEELAANDGEFAKQLKLLLGDSMGEITLDSGRASEHGTGKIYVYVGEDMRAGVYWGTDSGSGQKGFTAGELPEGVNLYD